MAANSPENNSIFFSIFLSISHTEKNQFETIIHILTISLGPIRDIQKDRDNLHNLLAINLITKWVHQMMQN